LYHFGYAFECRNLRAGVRFHGLEADRVKLHRGERSQKARLAGFAGECRAFEGNKTSKLKGRSTVGIGGFKRVF
jgi:hypothetical protein